MYFSSPTSTISSISSMSSSTASSLAMDIRPRSSSSFTSSSASGYMAWPYRSSVINAASSEEPSSYLSDEDLFFSTEEDAVATPDIEELSTEDHIAMLRKAAEQQEALRFWNYQQPQQRRFSRPQLQDEQKKKARPCMGKRKKSSTKKVVFATPAQSQG